MTRPIKTKLTSALVVLGLLTAACGGDDGGNDQAADSKDSSLPCGADPAVVEAAKKEGSVVLFGGGHTREGADLVAQQFEKAYGIKVTVNRQPSDDIVQQVEASLQAGAVTADVVSLSDLSAFIRWSEDKTIVDAGVENLDDIIDGLDDPSRPSVPYGVAPLGVMYNSSKIKPADAPKTWADIAKLDGKTLAHANPERSGTALAFMKMVEDAAGEGYYRKFDGQKVLATESALALTQLVLAGEADFGAPAIESEVYSAAQKGEPIAMVYPTDGLPVFSAELALLAKAPHPNAGKLLVQYHLCREFQDSLHTVGGRGVLEGAKAAEGLPDLTGRKVVTLDIAELGEEADALIQTFEAITK